MGKKSFVKKSMMMAAFCCFMSAPLVYAEENAAEVQTETEAEPKEEKAAPVVLEELSVGELKLSNATEAKAAQLFIKEASAEEWGANLLEEKAEAFSPEKDKTYDLKLCDEKDNALVFYNLALSQMDGVQLAAKEGKTYVNFKKAEGGEEVSMENYALEAYESAKTLYTKVNLNVRELPEKEGKLIETLPLGTEATAYGEANGWYLIREKDGYGYISGEYVTESKEEAEELVAKAKAEAEAAARAQAEAEAEWARQQEQQAYYNSQSSGGSSGGSSHKQEKPAKRVEVSRENVPSCDDGDHGTTYITYSDGSVEVIEY